MACHCISSHWDQHIFLLWSRWVQGKSSEYFWFLLVYPSPALKLQKAIPQQTWSNRKVSKWTCWKNLWRASARGRQGPNASKSKGSCSILILIIKSEVQISNWKNSSKPRDSTRTYGSNLSTALSPCCLKIGNYRCLKVLVADAAVFVNIHLLQSHINQVLTKISIKSCTTRKSSELQSCGWLSRRTRKLIESSNYILNTTCIQYYMDAENDKVGTDE